MTDGSDTCIARHGGHLQFNIDAEDVDFYRHLSDALGWQILHEDDGSSGVRKSGWTLWFIPHRNGLTQDHEANGLKHLGIEADRFNLVDQAADYIRRHGIIPQYDTPFPPARVRG